MKMKTLRIKILQTTLLTSTLVLLDACGSGGNSDTKNYSEKTNSSEFLSGFDGWKLEGDAELKYANSGGINDSGYIYGIDAVQGDTWYFVAPSKFHGDKSDFINGSIEYYLIQNTDGKRPFEKKDVIITSGTGEELVYKITKEGYPIKTWKKYKITLNDTVAWRKKDGSTANNNDIQSVLSDISKIIIRGEYEVGEDTGGLDNFKFNMP